MNDLFAEMEADQAETSELHSINTEGLKTIAEMARAVEAQSTRVSDLEALIKEEKKKLLKLTDEDLPALLHEIGMAKFELDDGSKIELKPTYGAHIKADNRDAAFGWLRSNGFDDIIKNTVSCIFGRGEDKKAETFIKVAHDAGVPASQKEEVHPSTLKAFVKERVENGEEFPMDLFGAYVGQRATIKKGTR
jgi:hypothetical protein|tara:strand:- start:259 stop:834 length:576 start_codon:yes stop_codon:yes gene_type:complete